jgi:bacillithiol system protein YtxJ
MKTQFVQVTEIGELEALFARSFDAPVIIFKHSVTCPISSAAYEQMTRLGAEVALIVVQKARDISQEIAKRTGIRHESPQAIVLRNGASVWNASHFAITSEAVSRAISEN